MSPIFKSGNLTTAVKIKLLGCNVFCVLVYGQELWTLADVTSMWPYRRMPKVSRLDQITSDDRFEKDKPSKSKKTSEPRSHHEKYDEISYTSQ